MNLWVGITDYDWFSLLASKESVEEVNFWRPSARQGFRALQPGGMFLFKLRSRKFIGGGGFFAKYLPLPLSLAWDAFGESNGAKSLDELRRLIARNRHEPISPTENPHIGCILIEEPFFFAENDWIPLPEDFKPGIQMGKTYDMRELVYICGTRLPNDCRGQEQKYSGQQQKRLRNKRALVAPS